MTLTSGAVALLLAGAAVTDPAAPPPPPPPPVAAPPAPPPAPPPSPAPAMGKDPAALAAVRRLADRIERARTFSFRSHVAFEFPTPAGPLATFHTEAKVAVRRPDGLAASRTGDLAEFRFAYDGASMTAYGAAGQRWGTTAAPPTLDALLGAAAEQGGLSFAADELLVADPYAAITKDLSGAVLVGRPTVGGRPTDHVLLTSDGLQLELWIDVATSLPAREVVVYTDLPSRPHYSIEYLDWKVDPKLDDKTFTLPKPPGATQVEFRAAAGAFR